MDNSENSLKYCSLPPPKAADQCSLRRCRYRLAKRRRRRLRLLLRRGLMTSSSDDVTNPRRCWSSSSSLVCAAKGDDVISASASARKRKNLSRAVETGSVSRDMGDSHLPTAWYGMVWLFLFFSRPRSEGWPHHGRTFSIYPCPLSF